MEQNNETSKGKVLLVLKQLHRAMRTKYSEERSHLKKIK